MQVVFEIEELPAASLDASAAFHSRWLADVRAVLSNRKGEALAIVLPPAGPDHADWRKAIARDLARSHAPGRVNVVAGQPGTARDAVLTYLAGAPGVTGQYCQTHD